MHKHKHVYNLRRDKPDSRDRVMLIRPNLAVMPQVIDLRPNCPAIYDQGDLGSCSANAIGAALDFIHKQDNPTKDFFNPSRLFIYFNERSSEGTIDIDAGASIRDGIVSVNQTGACKETTWPYDISQFKIKPPIIAYNEARDYQAIAYQRVPLIPDMIQSVLAANMPIVCGISIYSSFESEVVAKTGLVPLPDTQHEQGLGGHAVVIVGIDSIRQIFIIRNSWGVGWGQAGYFTVPFAYLVNSGLAWDAWAISKGE